MIEIVHKAIQIEIAFVIVVVVVAFNLTENHFLIIVDWKIYLLLGRVRVWRDVECFDADVER